MCRQNKTLTVLAIACAAVAMMATTPGCAAARANKLHHDVNAQTPPLCKTNLAVAAGHGTGQVKVLEWVDDRAEVINACGERMTCQKNMPGSLYMWQCVLTRRGRI